MRSYVRLMFLLAAFLAAGHPAARAAPAVADALDGAVTTTVTLAGERGVRFFFWRRHQSRAKREDRGARERAGFWGGPYWGYGARLGHPCQTCRDACRDGERSRKCDWCRSRCAW